MPASTAWVNFANGCLASYTTDGSTYTDLGVLIGDTQAQWNYEVDEVAFSISQKIRRYRNQSIAATIPLADLNPSALAGLSGNMLTETTTAAAPYADAVDQTIAADWTDMKPIGLSVVQAPAGGGASLILSAAPTLTSVTGSIAGALTEGVDYYLVEFDGAYSGWGIVLDTAGAAGLVTTESVVVDYGSVTPVETITLTGGSSTFVPSSIGLKFYDAASGQTIVIYSADIDSGGFTFGFKAVTTGGVQQMDLTFTGQLDETRTDGDRLFSVSYAA